jgi:hypothetical protein
MDKNLTAVYFHISKAKFRHLKTLREIVLGCIKDNDDSRLSYRNVRVLIFNRFERRYFMYLGEEWKHLALRENSRYSLLRINVDRICETVIYQEYVASYQIISYSKRQTLGWTMYLFCVAMNNRLRENYALQICSNMLPNIKPT